MIINININNNITAELHRVHRVGRGGLLPLLRLFPRGGAVLDDLVKHRIWPDSSPGQTQFDQIRALVKHSIWPDSGPGQTQFDQIRALVKHSFWLDFEPWQTQYLIGFRALVKHSIWPDSSPGQTQYLTKFGPWSNTVWPHSSPGQTDSSPGQTLFDQIRALVKLSVWPPMLELMRWWWLSPGWDRAMRRCFDQWSN